MSRLFDTPKLKNIAQPSGFFGQNDNIRINAAERMSCLRHKSEKFILIFRIYLTMSADNSIIKYRIIFQVCTARFIKGLIY